MGKDVYTLRHRLKRSRCTTKKSVSSSTMMEAFLMLPLVRRAISPKLFPGSARWKTKGGISSVVRLYLPWIILSSPLWIYCIGIMFRYVSHLFIVCNKSFLNTLPINKLKLLCRQAKGLSLLIIIPHFFSIEKNYFPRSRLVVQQWHRSSSHTRKNQNNWPNLTMNFPNLALFAPLMFLTGEGGLTEAPRFLDCLSISTPLTGVPTGAMLSSPLIWESM